MQNALNPGPPRGAEPRSTNQPRLRQRRDQDTPSAIAGASCDEAHWFVVVVQFTGNAGRNTEHERTHESLGWQG